MKTSDKIEIVKLMIETAEHSKAVITCKERLHGLVAIDAEKFIKRLNVELSLLEADEQRQIDEAMAALEEAFPLLKGDNDSV